MGADITVKPKIFDCKTNLKLICDITIIKKPDKRALEKERKEIISKMLRIQKEFMALEREKGVTEKDIHHNPQGIVKEYKEEHEKLANRLVDIAHALKGSIRT